jgi:predicted RNA-binding protein with PUA-like domain
MNYFLAKSDPLTYSLDDLARDGETVWDGVKNAQAVQAIRLMKEGDCVVIYHSQGEAAIVGWAMVTQGARPDPNDAKSAVVDLAYAGRLAEPVTLPFIKQTGLFPDLLLVRNSRLSTMALPKEFIDWLKKQRKDFRPQARR